MSLKICSIASGSSGNCIFVANETTKILIDIGVPSTRVSRALNVLKTDPTSVNVLVTHEHSDHINNVPSFCSKFSANVYAHYKTSPALTIKHNLKSARLTPFGDEDFYIGDITVSPFKVNHDVHCLGYSFYSKGSKISIATDLGVADDKVIEQMSDSDLVLLECNHDEDILLANPRYAGWLKKRILSTSGHLSNSACADAAGKLVKNGVKQIILGHLSKENNYPELAYNTVRQKLDDLDFPEQKVSIEVASPDRLSGLYEIL